MFTKVCVLLLAIGLSQAAYQPQLPESTLMQFMMRSRDINRSNPARSLGCFDIYLPQLNKAADDFQTAYAQCLAESEAARSGIDETTKDARAQIDSSASSACQALDSCSKISPSVDYFSCYSESGGENTQTMYQISANAAEWLAKVQEELRLINVNEYACTNKTERNHIEETADIYVNFNRCLEGLDPLTTAPPATTEPSTAAPPASTPEPSTAAPPEPTPEPSTAAPPEPTPEPSTAAPPEPTPEPSTAAPPEPTPEPSTAAPPEPTPEPSTAAPTEPTEPTAATEDDLPEEDLSRLAQEQHKLKQMMEEMKRWFKRY